MKVRLGRAALQGALALMLVLAIPHTAHAAGEGETRNYIFSIKRSYENLDYERALNLIQLARQLPRTTEEEVTLSFYEGIILCEMGKWGQASAAFESALFLRPDAKLPVQVAPKVEQLFESARKRVKSEMAAPSPTAQGTPESPPKKTEPVREPPPSAPTSGKPGEQPAPIAEKHEDKAPAPPPKKAEASDVQARNVAGQAVASVANTAAQPPASASPKVPQKSGAPVAGQPLSPPDCGTRPSSTSSRDLKERQLGRLASIKYELCLSGSFQGPVAGKWSELKTQMESAPAGAERTRISQDIDQFASEFLYTDPRWKARDEERQAAERRQLERKEAEQSQLERQQAEQREKEALRLEAERIARMKELRASRNLDTSRCQPVVSADCERLMKQLLHVQEAFLQTNPTSRGIPLKELVTIGQDLRSSLTREELQEAAHALDDWKQRNLSP